MVTEIGTLHVRRSGWIDAPPEHVWEEFTSLERMQRWFGTGHMLTAFEPRVGGVVRIDAGGASDGLLFSGPVLVYDGPRELTFEQDWEGHGWRRAPRITFRLTSNSGGTLVELFHHGFEGTSDAPGADLNGFEAGWDTHHLVALREIVTGSAVGR